MKENTVFGEHLVIQIPGVLLAHFRACLTAKDISENLREGFGDKIQNSNNKQCQRQPENAMISALRKCCSFCCPYLLFTYLNIKIFFLFSFYLAGSSRKFTW
jgi:hypothetical protein